MRGDESLKSKYRTILYYSGTIFLIVSLLMLFPFLGFISESGNVHQYLGFLLPSLLLAGLGFVLWRIFKSSATFSLTIQEGGVIVLVSWIVVCLISAWPFIHLQKMNFTQAVFEAVSGWTTTGLSVVDVTKTCHALLLWRSIMQLIGGAGFAVIMLSAITGLTGPGLSTAEGRAEQLVPHVRKSAKLVMGIYGGYALFGFLAYILAGMTSFDALVHAFSAVSTGGFSTHAESIAFWNSPMIEIVSIVLMILGNLNFLTAFSIFHAKFKVVSRSGEVRLFTVLFFLSSFIIFIFLGMKIYPNFEKSIRVTVFETISALTTTGFTSTSYKSWSSLGFLILIILMITGGGTCSTAGGIKQYRIYLLFKSLIWQIRRSFLPRTAVVENYIWQGDEKDYITDTKIKQVANFVFLYFVIYVLGSGILVAHGYKLEDSLFEFASALSTVGLSTGITTPMAPPLVLWTEILGMFLGRLEFLIIFIGLGKIIHDLPYLTH